MQYKRPLHTQCINHEICRPLWHITNPYMNGQGGHWESLPYDNNEWKRITNETTLSMPIGVFVIWNYVVV